MNASGSESKATADHKTSTCPEVGCMHGVSECFIHARYAMSDVCGNRHDWYIRRTAEQYSRKRFVWTPMSVSKTIQMQLSTAPNGKKVAVKAVVDHALMSKDVFFDDVPDSPVADVAAVCPTVAVSADVAPDIDLCFSPREEAGIELGFVRDISMTEEDWEKYEKMEPGMTLSRTPSFEVKGLTPRRFRKLFKPY